MLDARRTDLHKIGNTDFNILSPMFSRPRVVDLSFIVTRAHQKIKALFFRINIDNDDKFCKKIKSIKNEKYTHFHIFSSSVWENIRTWTQTQKNLNHENYEKQLDKFQKLFLIRNKKLQYIIGWFRCFSIKESKRQGSSSWVNLACIFYTHIIRKQPPEAFCKKSCS